MWKTGLLIVGSVDGLMVLAMKDIYRDLSISK